MSLSKACIVPHFRRDVSRRLFTHVACRAHLCPSNYIRPLQPKVGVRSRVRERQNENVILDVVKQHPVVLNVAIAKPNKVSAQCVVAILGWKGLAHRKHTNNINNLRFVLATLHHLLETLLEAHSCPDLVFHENINSSSLSGSVQVVALGSLATAFASASAACRRASLRCRPSVKGISPTSRHFLKKHVMAVVSVMPISSKNSSASAFKSLSIRIVNVVVIADPPLCCSNECIVSQSACKVNEVLGRPYRSAA